MKIPATYRNPTKISHPDKVGTGVVFSRLRDAMTSCACSLAWGLRSVAGSALLGCSDQDPDEQEPVP
jgi:hypothetical protein